MQHFSTLAACHALSMCRTEVHTLKHMHAASVKGAVVNILLINLASENKPDTIDSFENINSANLGKSVQYMQVVMTQKRCMHVTIFNVYSEIKRNM